MAIFKIGKQVMQSMFKKPATLMYPVIQREYFERTRGHISVDMDKCVLCSICAQKCPTNALKIDRKKKSWSIERMRCIQCYSCTEECPVKCLKMEKEYTSPNVVQVVDEYTKAVEEKPVPVATEAITE